MAFKIADGYVEVHGKVDDSSFRRAAHRAGRHAGEDFAHGFHHSSYYRFNKLMSLWMKPIKRVQSALTMIRMPAIFAGLAGSLIGLLPSLTKATFALSAGLIPAMMSLGSVVGVARLMLGDLGKTIQKQVIKHLNDMAGEIRKLAVEAAKPGFTKFLEGVIKNGPIFERYMQRIGQAIGDALGELGRLLQSGRFGDKLNSLLEQLASSTAIWTKSLDDVVEMIVTLGDAAGPIFDAVARKIARLTDRWRDWLNLKYETGDLQQALMDSFKELERWGRIVSNFIMGLVNLFSAGIGPSTKFAQNLERISKAFRDWTEKAENVEKVRKFLQWMTDHVGDFFRIAAAATAVATALKGITLVKGFASWVRTILKFGTVGVVLSGLGMVLAGLAAGFFLAMAASKKFFDAVKDLGKSVLEVVAPALKAFGEGFLGTFKKGLEGAAEKINGKGGLVAAFWDLAFAMDAALAPFGGINGALETLGEKLGELMSGNVKRLVTLITDLAYAVEGLVFDIGAAVEAIGTLKAALDQLPGNKKTAYKFTPGGALGLIGLVGLKVLSIPKVRRTLYQFILGGMLGLIAGLISRLKHVPRAARTIYHFQLGKAISFMRGVVAGIRRIPHFARTAYRFIYGGAAGAISWIKRLLGGIPRTVRTVYSIITNRITNFIKGLNPFGGASGGIMGARGMATGGVSGGSTVLVGERGPELAELPYGTRVVPAGQTKAALAGGGQRDPVVLEIRSGGSRLDDLLVDVLRKAIRGRGGDVQVVLGSR